MKAIFLERGFSFGEELSSDVTKSGFQRIESDEEP
jgi:hypothetical protein